MIKIIKTNQNINQPIFFKSSLGFLNLFLIDLKIKIPKNVKINNNNNTLQFNGPLGQLNLNIINEIFVCVTKNNIILNYNNLYSKKNKKSVLNLYKSLIQLKIKGILQGFKLNLFMKGLGFKANIEKKKLILKLGFSHTINIQIPDNIQIINNVNKLIFSSIDFIFLTKYVHFIKNHKKPEPYKGKGLIFKDEIVIRKEGKKSKK